MASKRPTGTGTTGRGRRSLLHRVRAILGGRPRASPADVAALRARRDALAARLEEERRAFAERARLYRQHPVGQGAFALPEVERKLGNLYRIRVGRLEADLAACQRELAALEGAEGPEP
ncbi:MAG: hypothetical protein AABZ75_04030 [candidate division NC10 bacterium]